MAAQTADRVPLFVDVDTGIDDALALLYACASPDVELLGAGCVGGNVDARQVAVNTRAVLELAGRTDVPVFLGRERPLVKPLETTTETHGPLGIGDAVLPPPSRPLEADDAATGLIRAARARPGEVLLVTLGPLTNLAVAVQQEPALPSLLRGWVLMGGAYRVPGNTTPTTEWNVYVDPHAARIAFAAWAGGHRPVRPLAMGLDVTEQARCLPRHLVALARRSGADAADVKALLREPIEAVGSVAGNPVLRFVVDALRFYFAFHAAYDGFYGAVIHDPFALAAALDRTLVRTLPVFVDVEDGPGLAHGMTVADWRGLTHRPPNVDVAVDARADAFLDRFVDRIGGLASGGPSVAR
jgi:purine nucleosidase